MKGIKEEITTENEPSISFINAKDEYINSLLNKEII